MGQGTRLCTVATCGQGCDRDEAVHCGDVQNPAAPPQERLEREYNLQLITTAPTVIYKCVTADGEELMVNSPADLPEVSMCGR